MRKAFFVYVLLITASFVLASCGEQSSGGNTANAANTKGFAPVADTAALKAEIKKVVTDSAASLSKNDVAAFEKGTIDDYMFVGPDGAVVTKAERLASFKSGDTKFESITFDDINVRTRPDGTGAVTISLVTVKGKVGGRAIDGKYRVTQVWTKEPDGWKTVSTQSTAVTASAPAKADDKKDGDKTADDDRKAPPANK